MALPPMPPMPMQADAAPQDAAPEAPETTTLVTICKSGDGSYMVYAGDEPDAGAGADMSADDADAMGDAGAEPAVQGQPADSVGAALKIALDILNSDASSEGAPGSADEQFAAGFSADKAPTPASGQGQKY